MYYYLHPEIRGATPQTNPPSKNRAAAGDFLKKVTLNLEPPQNSRPAGRPSQSTWNPPPFFTPPLGRATSNPVQVKTPPLASKPGGGGVRGFHRELHPLYNESIY